MIYPSLIWFDIPSLPSEYMCLNFSGYILNLHLLLISLVDVEDYLNMKILLRTIMTMMTITVGQ